MQRTGNNMIQSSLKFVQVINLITMLICEGDFCLVRHSNGGFVDVVHVG